MIKAIVERAFQFRGGMHRPGTLLLITEDDANDAWVKSHVKILTDGQEPPARDGYLGNGQPKGSQKTPAEIVGTLAPDASAQEIMKALDELNVHYAKSATRDQLEALLAKAKEAIAGSEQQANRPKGS